MKLTGTSLLPIGLYLIKALAALALAGPSAPGVRRRRAGPGQFFMGILSGVRSHSSGEADPASGDLRIGAFKPKKSPLDPIAYDWSARSGQIYP